MTEDNLSTFQPIDSFPTQSSSTSHSSSTFPLGRNDTKKSSPKTFNLIIQKKTTSKTFETKVDSNADLKVPEQEVPFEVASFDRVSSSDLQVQDGGVWRYASIHVHKKNQHVVIWYGGFEYEGLGLEERKSYRLKGFPKNGIFNGANGQLLDGDGDVIECKL